MILPDIINYIGVQFFSRLLPVVGIFIFARWMPAEDLGVVVLHLATVWIVATILSSNLYVGVGRLLFDPAVEDSVLLGTAIGSIAAFAAAAGAVWVLCSQFISKLTLLPVEVVLLQIPVALGLIGESVLTQVMIYQKKSRILLAVVAVKSVFLLALALMLVAQRAQQKYLGVIYADVAIALAMIVCAGFILRKDIKLRFSRPYLKSLTAYSVPLIVHALSLALLSQSDRILIGHLMDRAAVGTYSLAYMVGAAPLLIAAPILNAFQPRFFAAMNANETHLMRRDSGQVFFLMSLVTAGVICFGPLMARLVLQPSQTQALGIIPVVAMGALAQTHALIWGRVLAFHLKTVQISGIIVLCVALNIGLNLLAIPHFGFYGAAFSTLAAQILMMAGMQAMIRLKGYPAASPNWTHVTALVMLGGWSALGLVADIQFSLALQALFAVGFLAVLRNEVLAVSRFLLHRVPLQSPAP